MSETEDTRSAVDTEEEEASSIDGADVAKTEGENDAEKENELKRTEEKEKEKEEKEEEEGESKGRNDPESDEKSASNKEEVVATDTAAAALTATATAAAAAAVVDPEEKKPGATEAPPSKPAVPKSEQNSKPGECNLLPVLVERLRSALELSCSSQSSEDPLPLEDSGVDSEEDLRMWATGLCNSVERKDQSPRPLDLKFLEDLLLSDIQTALSRLQETLRKVDATTLAKYNSTLDSTNKLHLLRLISNLLSRLKIPEELVPEETKQETPAGSQRPQVKEARRKRANRHTIGVSAEEIAEARKLLDEKLLSAGITEPIKNDAKPQQAELVTPPKRVEKPAEFVPKSLPIQPLALQPQTQPEIEGFDQPLSEKNAKDAINQQHQTYFDKSNKEYSKDNALASFPASRPYQGDEEYNEESQAPAFYQQQPTASKYNKFVAKKSKIKRANTIDIPNYLKLQAESLGQGALRRPIDIGEKIGANSGNANIIPAFKPRTDSDRKFLALINRNNETATNTGNPPFRSFNYRQPENVDRNWNSRFSNIKTTFDKPPAQVSSTAADDVACRTHSSDSGESDGVVVGSLRLPYNAQPRPKTSGFTHAPTSPFQRIEKPSSRAENGNGNGNGNGNASIFKSGYLPQGGSSLMARVKIFNQEEPAHASIVARNKSKFDRLNDHRQGKTDSNREEERLQERGAARSYIPGSRGALSAKLIVNANASPLEIPEQNQPTNGRAFHLQQKEKPYVGFNALQTSRAAEIPARSSSHSFMMQKIASENNAENRPRVARYVNEALRLKDPPETPTPRHPLGPISHSYAKPVAPRENYPAVKTPAVTQAQTAKRNDGNRDAIKLQEFSHPSQRGNLERKEVPREPPASVRLDPSTSSGQNFAPAENRTRSDDAKPHLPPPDDPVVSKPIFNAVSSEADYAPRNNNPFPKPSSAFDGYVVPPSSDNLILHKSAQARETTRLENGPQNYPGKVAKYSDYHSVQDYVPYQSYQQARKESDKPKDDQPLPRHHERLQQPAIYGNSWGNDREVLSSEENNSNSVEPEVQPEVQPEIVPRSMIDLYREKQTLLEDENIQNQDISSEGIVTRYQCAIATVATTPESSEPDVSESQGLQGLRQGFEEPMKVRYNVEVSAHPVVEESLDVEAVKEEEKNESEFDEIQRHNLLQQQIIQQLKSEENRPVPPRRRKSLEKFKWDEKPAAVESDRRSLYIERPKVEENSDDSPTTPSYYFPLSVRAANDPSPVPVPVPVPVPPPAERQVEEPVIESNNTLEKINIFEEKSSLRPLPNAPVRQRFRPLSIPKFDKLPRDFPPGKVNVVTPSKAQVQLKSEVENSPVISSSTNIIDSSDEYLMSCANRQSRSIVLSKSESWHQLALSRGNLQPPQTTVKPLLKPPKPKSPASVRLSKQYEAPTSSDSMKRMEEKIQRYFNSPMGGGEAPVAATGKRESKSRRHFASKKSSNSQGSSGLARSQTMPHLYDDKLLDENTDVEKAFDSLFKEAIKSDNRY